jgi:3-phosphoshikimate 1-carboxyvinyltransferase
MKRIVDPLRLMGAKIQGQGDKHTAPLEIEGQQLTGIDYTLPVASAQLKSCLLLAGLFAAGTTSVTEKTPSRDHTERLLAHFHAPPIIDVHPETSSKTIRVRGGTKLHGRDFNVPGDFSSAAFWIAAAAAMPGADLTITNLGLNGTRTGLLSVLLRMGAHISEAISDSSCEPFGTSAFRPQAARHEDFRRGDRQRHRRTAHHRRDRRLAEGDTEIRDAKELRVKETDRIAAMATNLRAFGVAVTEHDDGMTIHGGGGGQAHRREGHQLRRSPHRHVLRCPRPLHQGRNDHQRHRLHRHLLPNLHGRHGQDRPLRRVRPLRLPRRQPVAPTSLR